MPRFLRTKIIIMLVYNVTTKVDHAILNEWIKWQQEIHIPAIIATGLFFEHKFFQLLEQDEEEGKTFVSQFFTESKENYEKYLQQYAPQLRKQSHERWAHRIFSFRSLLQEMI